MTTPDFIPALGGAIVIAQIPPAFGEERSLSSAPKSVPPQEAELIRRILAGEKALFYELVRPYERAVFVAAMSVVHNEPDAEDVAQEAVLKAFVNLKSFRAESKFSTWLI